jgi:hypothetical protein
MITTEQLNRFTTEEYSHLVRTQLRKAFHTDSMERGTAFVNLGVDYANWDSPVDVLEQLHKALNSDAQNRFEHALVMSLRNVSPWHDAKDVFECLVYAVGCLHMDWALPELMDALLSRGTWLARYPTLSYPIVSVLQGLAHTQQAEEQTRRWLSHSNFEVEYIFEAYVILAIGQPRRWAENFKVCLPKFQAAAQYRPDGLQDTLGEDGMTWFDRRLKQMIREHFETCERWNVLTGLKELNRSPLHHFNECHPLGKLLTYLLCQGDSPFYIANHDQVRECLVASAAPDAAVYLLPDDNGLDNILFYYDKQRGGQPQKHDLNVVATDFDDAVGLLGYGMKPAANASKFNGAAIA